MKKTYIIYALLLALTTNSIFSQNFNIPGEVSIDGEFKKGFFSGELNEFTNSLTFKYSDSEDIINLYTSENVIFKIDSKSTTFKTLNIDGYIHPFVLIVDGKGSFYKDLKSKNYYVQNTSGDSKIIKLVDFKSAKKNNRNVGILSIIFEDCIPVRSRLEKEKINESTLIKLTNNYNNCTEYSEGFELSSKQKKEQEYSREKSIYNIDIGGSLAFNNFNTQIPVVQDQRTKTNVLGYGAFISFNASPTYFNQVRDKLYFDISIAYSVAPEFEIEFFDVKRSSLLVSVSPTFYFLRDKKISPFGRANFGLNYSNFELTKNEESFFNDVKGKRKSFVFGIEAGIQVNRQFELSLLYQPKTKEEYTIFISNTLEVDNSVIALKASYIINLSKED